MQNQRLFIVAFWPEGDAYVCFMVQPISKSDRIEAYSPVKAPKFERYFLSPYSKYLFAYYDLYSK